MNADFERARAPGSANASQYAILEQSWWEQREWGITYAIDTLASAGHPLASKVQEGFDALKPGVPDLTGFVEGSAGKAYACGDVTIAFDDSGAISQLTSDSYSWADDNHTLLNLQCEPSNLIRCVAVVEVM